MTSLHTALRAATHAAHLRLEATMGLDPSTLTRARYGRALQVLHAVRTSWEPALAEFLPAARGPHLAWLEADLYSLDLPRLPPAAAFVLTSEPEAWGLSYVLEGSALGGRSMLRTLTPFGFTAEFGARYFAGRGEETGPHWSAFLARLDARATPDSVPTIMKAAQTAFEALDVAAMQHLTTS